MRGDSVSLGVLDDAMRNGFASLEIDLPVRARVGGGGGEQQMLLGRYVLLYFPPVLTEVSCGAGCTVSAGPFSVTLFIVVARGLVLGAGVIYIREAKGKGKKKIEEKKKKKAGRGRS